MLAYDVRLDIRLLCVLTICSLRKNKPKSV